MTTWPPSARKSPELLAIKDEGHAVIDELVADGVQRAKVYRRLAKKLGVPEYRAHFAKLNTIPEATRAVRILKEWLDARIKNREEYNSRKDKKHSETLSYARQQQAFADLKKLRARQEMWWWQHLVKPLKQWQKWLSTDHIFQRIKTLANESKRRYDEHVPVRTRNMTNTTPTTPAQSKEAYRIGEAVSYSTKWDGNLIAEIFALAFIESDLNAEALTLYSIMDMPEIKVPFIGSSRMRAVNVAIECSHSKPMLAEALFAALEDANFHEEANQVRKQLMVF